MAFISSDSNGGTNVSIKPGLFKMITTSLVVISAIISVTSYFYGKAYDSGQEASAHTITEGQVNDHESRIKANEECIVDIKAEQGVNRAVISAIQDDVKDIKKSTDRIEDFIINNK